MPVTVAPRPSRRGSLALVLIALLGLVIPGTALAVKPPPPPPVTIQILNASDWHGNIDPPGAAGGAWNISARWQADRLAFPTLTVAAGDDVGATPPLSSFFGDVPAVKSQRLMGIQVGTFGNHNFDSGIAHLQGIIDAAMAPSTGSSGDHPGSPYTYVAANLTNLSTNLTGVDPIRYFNVGGAKVAVIGIVNEEAPTLVAPGSFGTILISDGVTAANKFAGIARKAGANAVIVITHKGVDGLLPSPFGPLVDFTSGLTPGLVDVVIGDHTNVQYSGTVNGVLVHENLSNGATYSKTLMTVQPGKGGTVQSKSLVVVTPGPAGALGGTGKTNCVGGTPAATATFCDQALVDMLVPYRADLATALDPVIGTTTQVMDRGGNIERRQEVPLGDLIADAMRIQMGTQIGYMNSGGIRSQFPACGYAPVNTSLNRSAWNGAHTSVAACPGYAAGTPYDLVKGDVYTVLPFGNNTIKRNVTGKRIWQMLENGVSQCPSLITSTSTCTGRFPQISGFKFTFNTANATGCSGLQTVATWVCVPSRVTSVAFTDDTPIPYDDTVYTMAAVDFMQVGGDSYFMLADGTPVDAFVADTKVLLDYVASLGGVVNPGTFVTGRITVCPCT
ncbi:MAG: 5'-nucleotidase C-terminal domain-containing protein [Chloroflexi bacterium]|nr:5'-nucleotidase C-terminal domain-containing protein [Chloroflexota bacterium]